MTWIEVHHFTECLQGPNRLNCWPWTQWIDPLRLANLCAMFVAVKLCWILLPRIGNTAVYCSLLWSVSMGPVLPHLSRPILSMLQARMQMARTEKMLQTLNAKSATKCPRLTLEAKMKNHAKASAVCDHSQQLTRFWSIVDWRLDYACLARYSFESLFFLISKSKIKLRCISRSNPMLETGVCMVICDEDKIVSSTDHVSL